MIPYSQLRSLVQAHPKYPGCISIERSPLIHAGFPGNFNLSFTEFPWLQEFGKYINFNHDFHFSTIQSCIRTADIPLIGTNDSWKYLGVFEMVDLDGILTFKETPDYQALQKFHTKNLVSFLNDLGISKEKIHASYCTGGNVAELTKGKYNFNFQIPEDEISKQGFLEQGIPEENLIPDKTRDTFLAINLKKEDQHGGISIAYNPWGYRNEIYLELENKEILDVATMESLRFHPKYDGEKIVEIEKADYGASVFAFGLERLCIAINNLQRVQDVDYVKPFYDEMEKQTSEENFLAGESLRALHRIYSDIEKFRLGELSKPRRKVARKILQNIPKNLSEKKIKYLLRIHSETQPWHPEMKSGIEPTMERIRNYREAKN